MYQRMNYPCGGSLGCLRGIMACVRTLSLIALVVVIVTTVAAPAHASVTRKKAMWGPIEVNGISQFPVYADLGVGIYQTSLAWDRVAPTRPASARNPLDPAYRWPP